MTTGSAGGPLISVVIPTFNVAPFLRTTLQSVQQQSETRWECVVVDDGSTDGSFEVALEFALSDNRITVVRQANGGASAARNRGFRLTSPTSAWVSFMDSDDVWRPHALAALLANAERPGTVGAHGLAEMIDDHGDPIQPGSYAERGRSRLALQGRALLPLPLDHPTDFDVLINGNVLFPPGLVLARRSAYEAVGPFDESLNGPEDWDMLIRLSRIGGLTFVDDVILDYRRHGSNLGARPTVAHEAWLVRCLNFWSHENSPDQRRRARMGWRAYQRQMRRQRGAEVRAAWPRRDFRGVAGGAASLSMTLVRQYRGFPLPRVTRPPLRW